jgi:solute carrier family 25 uncoupling protein 8/9
MASAAGCVAEAFTIPIDTAKVRLQLQKVTAGEKPKYVGMVGTLKTIQAEEGSRALFAGLSPGLQRQLINCGLRVGLYAPIRDTITGPLAPGQQPSLLQKIAAGICSGAIGITFANPTDVVKIRMQA